MKKALWLMSTLGLLAVGICFTLFGCSSNSMGLRVTSVDWQEAHISWDAVTGATSYRILSATSFAGPYQQGWTSATTTFDIPMSAGFPWTMGGAFEYGQTIYVKVESVGGTVTTSDPLAITFKNNGHIGCWVWPVMGNEVLNLNANGVYTKYWVMTGTAIDDNGDKGTYTVNYDAAGGVSHITLTRTQTYNGTTWSPVTPTSTTFTLDLEADGSNNAPGSLYLDSNEYEYESAPLTP